MLYKNFLLNLPENILARKTDIIKFIDQVIGTIYEHFELDRGMNIGNIQKKVGCLKIRQGPF